MNTLYWYYLSAFLILLLVFALIVILLLKRRPIKKVKIKIPARKGPPLIFDRVKLTKEERQQKSIDTLEAIAKRDLDLYGRNGPEKNSSAGQLRTLAKNNGRPVFKTIRNWLKE